MIDCNFHKELNWRLKHRQLPLSAFVKQKLSNTLEDYAVFSWAAYILICVTWQSISTCLVWPLTVYLSFIYLSFFPLYSAASVVHKWSTQILKIFVLECVRIHILYMINKVKYVCIKMCAWLYIAVVDFCPQNAFWRPKFDSMTFFWKPSPSRPSYETARSELFVTSTRRSFLLLFLFAPGLWTQVISRCLHIFNQIIYWKRGFMREPTVIAS